MYTDQNGQGVFGSLVPSMKCFQSVQILSFRAHKGDSILEIRKRPSRVKIGTLTLFSDRSQAGHRRPVFENGIVANLLPNLWTIFSHSYLSGTSAFYGRKNIAQFWAGFSNGIIWTCQSKVFIDLNSVSCENRHFKRAIQTVLHNANIWEFFRDLLSPFAALLIFRVY